MAEPKEYLQYFDEAWKKIIERFFFEILEFFTPELYKKIDCSQSFHFLDKEMEQMGLISVKGAKYADKLAEVYLKDGTEQWILIHIEVQGEAEEDFSKRMFRYFYKIFDRYDKPIVSMAILTGEEEIPDEGKFKLMTHGSGVDFRYLTPRLMDYDREKLLKNKHPIALIVLASMAREKYRQQRGKPKVNVKVFLIKELRKRGYSEKESEALAEFIDWVIRLTNDENELFVKEIQKEVKTMPYVTTFERFGVKKGLQQGLQQGSQQEGRMMVVDVLDELFGEVPTHISNEIDKIDDQEALRALHRQAIRAKSIEEFQQVLNSEYLQ